MRCVFFLRDVGIADVLRLFSHTCLLKFWDSHFFHRLFEFTLKASSLFLQCVVSFSLRHVWIAYVLRMFVQKCMRKFWIAIFSPS